MLLLVSIDSDAIRNNQKTHQKRFYTQTTQKCDVSGVFFLLWMCSLNRRKKKQIAHIIRENKRHINTIQWSQCDAIILIVNRLPCTPLLLTPSADFGFYLCSCCTVSELWVLDLFLLFFFITRFRYRRFGSDVRVSYDLWTTSKLWIICWFRKQFKVRHFSLDVSWNRLNRVSTQRIWHEKKLT